MAVLDFVKPSPHGTQWGLGGYVQTVLACVYGNVWLWVHLLFFIVADDAQAHCTATLLCLTISRPPSFSLSSSSSSFVRAVVSFVFLFCSSSHVAFVGYYAFAYLRLCHRL